MGRGACWWLEALHEKLAINVFASDHLFAGSDGGGHRWAVICSLIETAKLNEVEPYAWLNDVLTRMVGGHPINRLDELMPWNWALDHRAAA
jgi:transposase